MKVPCSALGTLPHLSEFSAHTYPLQLQADTVLSLPSPLWAGRSVEGQPDGTCLHPSGHLPLAFPALGISHLWALNVPAFMFSKSSWVFWTVASLHLSVLNVFLLFRDFLCLVHGGYFSLCGRTVVNSFSFSFRFFFIIIFISMDLGQEGEVTAWLVCCPNSTFPTTFLYHKIMPSAWSFVFTFQKQFSWELR